MSNPNNRSFTTEADNDDSDSGTSFLSPRPAAKPLSVNKRILNFSLNPQKEQRRQQAQAQQAAEQLRAERETLEEEDAEAESDTPSAKPRRKGVARSIRAMLKRRRTQIAAAVAPEAVPVAAESKIMRESVPAIEQPQATEALTPEPQPTPAAEAVPKAEVTSEIPLPPSFQFEAPDQPEPTKQTVPAAAVASANLAAASSAYDVANFVPPAAAMARPLETPAIVERGSGAGPLVAFLAANYLSKRRDRKIRREAQKTNQKLEETQTRLRTEANRTTHLEETVAKNPSTVAETPAASERQAAAPAHVAEVLAAKTTIRETTRQPESTAVTAPFSKEKPVQVPPATASSPERPRPPQAESQPSPNAARDAPEQQPNPKPQEIITEKELERHHEVKDDSTAPKTRKVRLPTSVSASKSSAPATAPPFTPRLTYAPATDIATSSPAGTSQPSDIYGQSIRVGFTIGIAVIIMGFVAYLFL
ncbi:MAG: hypothetical protein ACR2FM_03690 [Candidatus Saccharimonadales bacterium]